MVYRSANRCRKITSAIGYVTHWTTRWGWKASPAHAQFYAGALAKATKSHHAVTAATRRGVGSRLVLRLTKLTGDSLGNTRNVPVADDVGVFGDRVPGQKVSESLP